MLAKLFITLAACGLAMSSTLQYIKLTKELRQDLPPHLRCEALLLSNSYATYLRISKITQTGLVYIAKVTPDGVETQPDLPANDTSIPAQTTVIISATGELNKAGISDLEATFPLEKEGIEYGDYVCEVTYVEPSHNYVRKIQKSRVLKVGKGEEIQDKLELLQSDLKQLKDELHQRNLRQMVWPRGNYSLIMPRYGCPKEDLAEWSLGTRIETLQSKEPNVNDNNTAEGLPLDLFWLDAESGLNMQNLSFCSRDPEESGVISFPKGNYCIHRKGGYCPEGFSEGLLRIDDNDDDNLNDIVGDLPDGAYDLNTMYIYCCREDAKPDCDMYLPITEPFYLYRYKGECQKVACMKVTNQFLLLDTANYNQGYYINIDEQTGSHPDGTINNVRLELCYYEPIGCSDSYSILS